MSTPFLQNEFVTPLRLQQLEIEARLPAPIDRSAATDPSLPPIPAAKLVCSLSMPQSSSSTAAATVSPPQRLLLFFHATGFCKEVWYPVFRHLRSLGCNDYLLAMDQRNHGDSASVNNELLKETDHVPMFDWANNARDVASVTHHLKKIFGIQEFIGIGHSCGGCAVLHTQIVDRLFSKVVAFEPILMPQLREEDLEIPNPMAVGALKRRADFTSREEAFENYRKKQIFENWTTESLQCYVDGGLRLKSAEELSNSDASKPFVLKCSPAQEAKTFNGSMPTSNDIFLSLHQVKAPAAIFAGQNSRWHLMLPIFKSEIPLLVTEAIENCGHLLVMENPELIASKIWNFIENGN